VIGWENRTFVWSQSKSPGYGILPANHRAVFCVDHQTTEFRQTTVFITTVVDPSQRYRYPAPCDYCIRDDKNLGSNILVSHWNITITRQADCGTVLTETIGSMMLIGASVLLTKLCSYTIRSPHPLGRRSMKGCTLEGRQERTRSSYL